MGTNSTRTGWPGKRHAVDYVQRTNDTGFLETHRGAVSALRDRLLSRHDAETGLYSSLHDSQDEFQALSF